MAQINNLKKTIKLGIIFICIALIVYYFRSHTDEIRHIQNISIADVMFLFGLMFLVQIIHSYKILAVVRFLGLTNINFIEWFKIITVSRFVNQHVFQGANLYRFIKLKKDYQFSYINSFGATVSFVWLETVSILFTAVVIISVFLKQFPDEFTPVLFYLLVILTVVAAVSLLVVYGIKLLSPGMRSKFKINEQNTDIIKNVLKQIKKPKFILFYIFCTFLFVFVYMLAIKVCTSAIGLNLMLFQNLLFTLVLILSRMFNIVPANLGISEILCGLISSTVNISFGNGVIISGIVRVINYILYGIVTLITYSSPSLRSHKDS